jgi:hypothetical protein
MISDIPMPNFASPAAHKPGGSNGNETGSTRDNNRGFYDALIISIVFWMF